MTVPYFLYDMNSVSLIVMLPYRHELCGANFSYHFNIHLPLSQLYTAVFVIQLCTQIYSLLDYTFLFKGYLKLCVSIGVFIRKLNGAIRYLTFQSFLFCAIRFANFTSWAPSKFSGLLSITYSWWSVYAFRFKDNSNRSWCIYPAFFHFVCKNEVRLLSAYNIFLPALL